MFELKKILRPNIRDLKPYSSARDEYHGEGGIFLDANENPYGRLNRYPDPHHIVLRERLGALKSVAPENIFIGNGSDEIIDLVFRIFCTPGRDKVLSFNPTYGMYAVAAAVNDVELITSDLDENFQIRIDEVKTRVKDPDLKMIIICSPNNPTGNLIDNIGLITGSFNGIVLVDEAYIDFAQRDSLINRIGHYQNLIVCQTFSKALGLAAARVGVAYASSSIIDIMYKVKPPYNVSKPDQDAAISALDDFDLIRKRTEKIIEERKRLEGALRNIPFVRKVWPSDANFLLVEVDDAEYVYKKLLEENIIVRNRSRQIKDTLRITAGTPSENIMLVSALRRIAGGNATSDKSEKKSEQPEALSSGRCARVIRSTTETCVVIDIALEGNGISSVGTGIGFFDHMLSQLSKHGGFDIDISAAGDLHVDQHHTIEDVALTLGEAFDKALGARSGIERYGFMLPMDDALAQAAIDFGGRPYLVWDVQFQREYLGEMPTEMIKHFFRSFTEKARCNLNIRAEGDNEHHKAEAVFKAFSRAAAMAVKRNGTASVPSTKGIL